MMHWMLNHSTSARYALFAPVVAAGLFLSTGSARAVSEEMTLCDYCSGSQYSQKAMETIDNGSVYVINRPASVVKKFIVVTEYEPGSAFQQATEVAPDDDDLQDIQKGLDFYHAIRQGAKVQVGDLDLPSGTDPDSALDLVGRTFWRNDLGLAVSNWVHDQRLTGFVGMAADVLHIANINLKGTVTVNFPDGSSYLFTFEDATVDDSGKLTLFYQIKPGSGIGPDGHRIPEAPGDLAGAEIQGSTSSIGEWIDAAQRLGVSVDTSLYSTTEVIQFTMTCGQDKCTVHPD